MQCRPESKGRLPSKEATACRRDRDAIPQPRSSLLHLFRQPEILSSGSHLAPRSSQQSVILSAEVLHGTTNTHPFQSIICVVYRGRKWVLRSHSVVDIDGNTSQLCELPTKRNLRIESPEHETSTVVNHEYRAAILRQNFWFMYPDGYGCSIADRYLPVFLCIVHLPGTLRFGELPLLREESGSQRGNVDIVIEGLRRRRVFEDL